MGSLPLIHISGCDSHYNLSIQIWVMRSADVGSADSGAASLKNNVEEYITETKELVRWFSTIKLDQLFLLHTPKEKKKKHDWQTVMCLILYEVNGYLLPLGLILTEVRSSRVSWQFQRFPKSGRVSALRLKSQKWFKRFFLERPVLPDCIPRLQILSGRAEWHNTLTRISFMRRFAWKLV